MKRIAVIDSLKGFAIFCVVWGHSIQYLQDNAYYFLNPVFEIIYSFHMPLFFLISGFFFKSSLKKDFKEFSLKKLSQLLLPCFVWAVIFMGVNLITGNIAFDVLAISKMLANPTYWPFWFLKELCVSYFLMYVLYRFVKSEWLVLVIAIVFVMLNPYYCDVQRNLLPFFIAGIILKDHYSFFSQKGGILSIILGVVFVVCLLFWNGNYTIYENSFHAIIDWKSFSFNLEGVNIYLFRLLIGFSGSMFFFSLFHAMKTNWALTQLAKMGVYTLGIYVLQTSILEYILHNILSFNNLNIWLYSLCLTPVISMFVILFSVMVICLVNRSKYLGFFLLGTPINELPK